MAILITGGTGCVGSYVLRGALERGEDVVAVLRHPDRLPADIRDHPRLRVVQADIREVERIAPAMEGVRAAILVSTAWGGPDTMEITCDANLALADRLAAAGCTRLFYFSSASVLERDGTLSRAARDLGSDYIRAKHALVERMEARAFAGMQVTGVFPTLVMGGTAEGPPLSHVARMVPQVLPYLWLVRLLRIEGRMHLIHAADIATVVLHHAAADGPPAPARLILGNPPSDVEDLIAAVCRHQGRRRRGILPVAPIAEMLIRAFRIRLSPWDRHCMDHPDQSYPDARNPAFYGLPVAMPSLESGLDGIGIPRR